MLTFNERDSQTSRHKITLDWLTCLLNQLTTMYIKILQGNMLVPFCSVSSAEGKKVEFFMEP